MELFFGIVALAGIALLALVYASGFIFDFFEAYWEVAEEIERARANGWDR